MENIDGNGNDDGRTDVARLANAIENKAGEVLMIELAADLLTHKYHNPFIVSFQVEADSGSAEFTMRIPLSLVEKEIVRREREGE